MSIEIPLKHNLTIRSEACVNEVDTAPASFHSGLNGKFNFALSPFLKKKETSDDETM